MSHEGGVLMGRDEGETGEWADVEVGVYKAEERLLPAAYQSRRVSGYDSYADPTLAEDNRRLFDSMLADNVEMAVTLDAIDSLRTGTRGPRRTASLTAIIAAVVRRNRRGDDVSPTLIGVDLRKDGMLCSGRTVERTLADHHIPWATVERLGRKP